MSFGLVPRPFNTKVARVTPSLTILPDPSPDSSPYLPPQQHCAYLSLFPFFIFVTEIPEIHNSFYFLNETRKLNSEFLEKSHIKSVTSTASHYPTPERN